MDKYKLDGTKIMYHPKEVSKWLKGEDIYPIYVEVSPVNYCNHHCTFCGLDYKHGKTKLDTKIMIDALSALKKGGTKSIMFGGAGEPFLHKDLPEIIEYTHDIGLDIGLTTNGSMIKEKDMEVLLKCCSWIKISFNGGDPGIYKEIHGADDCQHVRDKMSKLGWYKKEKKYKCTLGTQILLLPDNYDSIEQLIIESTARGFDYCVIKPYSQHLASNTHKYEEVNYSKLMFLKNKLAEYNSKTFQVIFRENAILRKDKPKKYKKCYSVPYFWSYIECDGNVWVCSCFLDLDDKFCIGNINENSFKELWENRNRNIDIDIKKCRNNCRMESCNEYLEKLKDSKKSEHLAFI